MAFDSELLTEKEQAALRPDRRSDLDQMFDPRPNPLHEVLRTVCVLRAALLEIQGLPDGRGHEAAGIARRALEGFQPVRNGEQA